MKKKDRLIKVKELGPDWLIFALGVCAGLSGLYGLYNWFITDHRSAGLFYISLALFLILLIRFGIVPSKMGALQEHKEHHELKKLKIEKGYKSINWSTVLVTSLICIVVLSILVGTVFMFFFKAATTAFSDSVVGISEGVGDALKKNPEMILALNEDIPDEVMYLTILKGMGLEADVDMYFDADFTTRTKRRLEKVNLSCIDEYDYATIRSPDSLLPIKNKDRAADWFTAVKLEQELKDKGCEFRAQASNYTMYKCPKRNCAMKEITYLEPEEFIPKKLRISRISAATGTK